MLRYVPDGWRVEKLGEICQFINGYAFKSNSFQNNGIPIIRIGNLVNNKINLDDVVSYEEDNKLEAYTILRDDILIAMSGATTGKMAFSELNTKLYLNQRIGSIRSNEEILLSKYLFNYLIGKKSYLLSLAGGSAQPNLSSGDIKKLDIPIPSLPQQEKIVKVLDISSALIEEQKELIGKYDLFLKSKFIEMFGDPIKNIHNWDIVNLEDVIKIDAPMVEPNNPEYQDMFHIGPNRIEKHTGKLLPALMVKEERLISKKFLFDESYILYSKIRPNLNKVAIVSFTGLCSADMYPIKPIKGKIVKLYLWRLLLSKFFLLYTESLPGRANIPKLNRKELAKFSFPLPPMELQNKFSSIVEKIESMKEQENKKLRHLETLHSSLMDKAFKGEIQ